MRLSELGEDGFLEGVRERIPAPRTEVRLGMGDDAAALLLPANESTLITTDTLIEEIHFTHRTLSPRFLGRKAVAVNVSDIAAMGGRPIALLISLSAPRHTEVEKLYAIFDGLIERAGELQLDVVGGNLSDSPGPLVLDVTVIGTTLGGKLLERRGASAEDGIFVSGRLGASAEGLELLRRGMALSASGALMVPAELREGPLPLAERCIRAHLDPDPRVELGRFLCSCEAVSACMDISDGFGRDLVRLCAASGVGARIEEAALPIHPGVLAWENLRRKPPLEMALAGGEDYELLFTVRDPSALEPWHRDSELPLTRVGTVTPAQEGVRLILRNGQERALSGAGWDHFRRAEDTSGEP